MTISEVYEGMVESLQRNAIHLSLLLNDGRRVNLRFAVRHEKISASSKHANGSRRSAGFNITISLLGLKTAGWFEPNLFAVMRPMVLP
jgi:hypothetical protein